MVFSLYNRIKFKKIHHFSGIILSLYIFFHLVNHLFALAGPGEHIRIMEIFRKAYRNPIIESLLLAVVAFQVTTGFRLVFQRRAKITAEKIQVYTGLYLSFFLIAHVAAVLIGRYVEHFDTNFYYAAWGMNLAPATLIFIPYYFLSVVAISLHVSALHYLKTKSKFAYVIAGTGITTAILILMGFTNWFNWLTMPLQYHEYMKTLFGN